MPMPAKPSDPVAAARHDLVLANRILADESVGILDTSGHVSLRNPNNPNSYFVATAAPGSVTDKDILAYCKERLTGYKRPKLVEFRTELPKTNVGKILRRELRDGRA